MGHFSKTASEKNTFIAFTGQMTYTKRFLGFFFLITAVLDGNAAECSWI